MIVPKALVILDEPNRLWRVLECPLCGNEHSHSAGPAGTNERRQLGNRVAPCRGLTAQGYILVTRLLTVATRTLPDRQPQRHGEGHEPAKPSSDPAYPTSTAPGPSTGPTDNQIVSNLLYSDWNP